MSLSAQNLLDISEAQCTLIESAGISTAIPSPQHFSTKAAFFNSNDSDQDTKDEIDTTLIDAVWVKYVNFEDVAGDEEDAQAIEAPVRYINYEFEYFSEATQERLDETETPDAFDKRVSKIYHEHVAGVMALLDEFQGTNPIPALASDFPVAETVSLTQVEPTEDNVLGTYVPVLGLKTKLICQVRVQLPC